MIGVTSSGRGSVANKDNGHEEVYRSSKRTQHVYAGFAARRGLQVS
jgi:hypothetical protein